MITHKIKKGFDIRLAGASAREVVRPKEPLVVAVCATDFPGIKAKPLVQDGDSVRTGDPLFFDKRDPDTAFLSPATGTVTNVVLGQRRALQRIEVTPAEADDFADIAHVPVEEIGSTPREELVLAIKRAGLWPLLRERPVGRIADGSKRPAAIYVNGLDTEPLAADPAYAVTGQLELLQAGVYLLDALTPGPVYLTVRAGEVASDLLHLKGVEFHAFDGPHPAGLVGTHIRSIHPLRADETAWFLKAQELAILGRWVTSGRYPFERTVGLAGSEARHRAYYQTRQGASLLTLMLGKPLEGDVRVINGTVLTGTASDPDGYLGFYAQTVTIIPEGTGERDLFGWLLPQFRKRSASRSVWSWLWPKAEYTLDARMNGGERAIVNLGLWESVMPLDIYPTYLVRAIQANDLEEAINLGLLEVTEEDVALCTFVDPGKLDVGAIIRQGLDLYEAEG
jgi:Na+-transporting NADH:ubiquinone oxidoreductase subunit A